MRRAISRSLLALGLTSVLALSACGGGDSACAAGSVEMPAAPPPAPKPPAPAPKAPAPAPKPAAPQPAAPKPAAPAPKVAAPKPYVPPPIYRPTDSRMNRSSPSYDYRTVYVHHQADHTPLLFLLAMNGAFTPSHAPQGCVSK